ncbi:MAG: hypothetical protein ABR589_08365 [Chthoniobacterales bacterium]
MFAVPRLVALLIFCSFSAHAEVFFPTAEGATWEYEVAGAGAGATATVRIAGKEQSDGKELLKLETVRNGSVTKTEFVTVDDGGLFCHRRATGDSTAVVFNPPQILVPAPLKIGTTWELDDAGGGGDVHQQFSVVAQEDVVVPAGSYRAYHLHCKQPWPISVTIDRWFVPGTGVIKEVTTTRGPSGRLLSRVALALKNFSVAPPAAAPAEENAASPGPPAPSPAALTLTLEVSNERDGQPQREFRSDAPNIFVRWAGDTLPMNGYVRVAWVAEDVGDIVPANFVVDETETEVTSPTFGARFTLSRPKDGWAAGKYRVELYLDDTLMQTVNVTIRD